VSIKTKVLPKGWSSSQWITPGASEHLQELLIRQVLMIANPYLKLQVLTLVHLVHQVTVQLVVFQVSVRLLCQAIYKNEIKKISNTPNVLLIFKIVSVIRELRSTTEIPII